MRVVVMTVAVTMAMPVAVAMSVAVAMVVAAQQPYAHEVDQQTNHRYGNRFAEMNRHRRYKTRHGLVADQHSNHREHDGTREPREVAELARTEHKAGVGGVLARVDVRERCNQ